MSFAITDGEFDSRGLRMQVRPLDLKFPQAHPEDIVRDNCDIEISNDVRLHIHAQQLARVRRCGRFNDRARNTSAIPRPSGRA